jgi:hypothetical protein
MAPMVEQAVVMLIVAFALGYSLWRLLPARLWQWRPHRSRVRPSFPGCGSCPAGADCAKRR